MRWFPLLALVAGASASSSPRPADETVCPAEVVVSELAKSVPKGWVVGQAEPRRALSGVGFFLGPPEKLAALVNDEEQPAPDAKNGSVAIWRFPAAKESYWIACYYKGTTLTLRRPLPAGIGLCRVNYDGKLGSGPVEVKSMSCER